MYIEEREEDEETEERVRPIDCLRGAAFNRDDEEFGGCLCLSVWLCVLLYFTITNTVTTAV